MNRHLVKLTLTMLSLGMVSPSFADNGNVRYTNPYFGLSGWTFKVGFPYQKFSNDGTNFAANEQHEYNVDTSWNWGYTLGIGYHFPVTGTDINFDYTHINSSDSHRIWGSNLWLMGGNDASYFSWAKGKIDFTYEAFNLTGGHVFDLSPTFSINYYGGLSYLHLSKDMDIVGRTDMGSQFLIEGGTSYKGFGPIFGIGGNCYPLFNVAQFSVFGDVSTAFYYGTLDRYQRSFDNTIDSDFVVKNHLPDEHIVVPGVNAKIGLNYAFPLRTMKLNTQLGYSFSDYFNVSEDSSYYGSKHDISFQGPYFTLAMAF